MSLNQTKNEKTMNMNLSATQQQSMLGTNQTMTKYSEDEYNNYIDSSDLVVEYYKKNNVTGLENQFLKIDNWLNREIKNPEDNVPMVIVANEGVGKKTLLVKWMEFHQENDNQKQPDIILPHFATTGGNNSNYFFAIYQFLIKLREILDVKQKVELLEEKLRSYFAYWLGVCHDSIERQIIEDKEKIYNKIILVIEGIDHFVDQDTGKEAAVAFWLPRFFPPNIRVICTADKNSEALAYFQRSGIEPMYISVDSNIVQQQITNHMNLTPLIEEELKVKHMQILENYDEERKINLFVATYMAFFLPTSSDILDKNEVEDEKLTAIFNAVDYDKVNSAEQHIQLFEIIIEAYQKSQLINHNNLIKLLQVFCLSQKGNTLFEIQNITNIDDEEWKAFLICFKDFFIFYKDMWILNNDPFKKFILQKYLTPQLEIELHFEIAEAIDKHTVNSIRKLEEQTFHLFKCGDQGFFKLKEIISTIENFLLLFNPNNKYDLCRYWQSLEEKGFDPVIEYNKAIEGFEMHYHPSPEDVFRIIVQISRFLKEFSDFETYYTPDFRHPPIKGTLEELGDIGLLRELHQLGIYLNKEGDDVSDLEQRAGNTRNPQDKINEGMKKLRYGGKDEEIIKIEQSNMDKKTKVKRKMQILREKKKEKEEQIKENNERKVEWQGNKKVTHGVIGRILNKVEQLNVDIPVNRQYFREYYVQQLQKIMNEEDPQNNQNEGVDGQNGQQSVNNQTQVQSGVNSNQQGGQQGGAQAGQEDKQKQNKLAALQEQQNAEQQLLNKKIQNEQEIQEQFYQMHKNDFDEKGGRKDKNRKGNGQEKNRIISYHQLKDHYNLKQHETTNYYYKRWLWIQYPWACMSLKCDYSSKLKKCFSSATEYMSVTEEKKFTKQALKIAIEAKLKKQSMYQRKNPNEQSSIIKANVSRISHNSSLPQLNAHHMRSQTKQEGNILGKSQTLSRIDPNESREMPSKIKSYNKSMTHKRNNNDSVGFFITEEYCAMPNINRELEKTQTSPIRQNNSKIQKLLQNQSMQHDTQRVLQKQKKFKDKSQLFDPLNSLNETKKPETVLPRLKQNINDHSHREIYILQQQSFDMKNTLNNLISENQKMAKSLKHLKQIQGQQNQGLDGNNVQLQKQKLENTQKQIEETQNKYYFNVMQIERLKIILRISEENKKQNQEWIRYLNFLLNNLNKMIKWEQENIKKCKNETKELQKIDQSYRVAFEEKMDNHERLIQQIKQNLILKRDVDGIFGRSDNVIEKSAFNQIEKMKNDQSNQDYIRKQKERQDQNQNKQRDIGQQLEEQRAEYEKLGEVIPLQGQTYNQSEEYQKFSAEQEKQQELNAILLERDDQIYDLKKAVEEKKNRLLILEKASQQNKFRESQKQQNQQKEKQSVDQQQSQTQQGQEQQGEGNENEQQQQQEQEDKKSEQNNNNNNQENSQQQQQNEQQQQQSEQLQKQPTQEQQSNNNTTEQQQQNENNTNTEQNNNNNEETKNQDETQKDENNQENQDQQQQDQSNSQQQQQENEENDEEKNLQEQQEEAERNQEKAEEEERKRKEEEEEQKRQEIIKKQEEKKKRQQEAAERRKLQDIQDEEEDSKLQAEEEASLPTDQEKLSIYFENKASKNFKLEQVRLSLVGIIQTSQKKLKIDQSKTVKETIDFDVEEMQEALQNQIDLIKSRLDEEDYNKFMGGDYDKNKMYKGLIEDVSEYGYDGEEDPGDDAFDDESHRENQSNM